MKSNRDRQANDVIVPVERKNAIDNSNSLKGSWKIGQLIPTYWTLTNPGDSFSLKNIQQVRLPSLVSPIMDQLEVVTFWAHCDNQVLWDEWDDFITAKPSNPTHPYFSYTGVMAKDYLGDYLDYPSSGGTTFLPSAFPHAMYMKVWDDHIRDDDLQDEIFDGLVAGSNNSQTTGTSTYYAILTGTPLLVNYGADYFQKLRPEAQQGTAIEIPLVQNTTATVDLLAASQPTPWKVRRASDHSLVTGTEAAVVNQVTTGDLYRSGAYDLVLDPDNTLGVDIQGIAQTISALRSAIATQQLLELENRAGQRIVEHTLGTWKHRIPDYRAGRSEIIGMQRFPIQFSEVLATAEGTSTEVGDYTGHGMGIGQSKTYNYTAQQHGVLMCFTFVTPKTSYWQGYNRMLLKTDRYDYPWLQLANIGDQAITNKEVYSQHTTPDGTFGYGPMYEEYRLHPNKIKGDFKDTLKPFHLGREFSSSPALNEDFIQVDPDNHKHVFADQTGDHIWAHYFHKVIRYTRLPKHGIPMLRSM
jgi:hypothetical protein